jgi:hypothetical protein
MKLSTEKRMLNLAVLMTLALVGAADEKDVAATGKLDGQWERISSQVTARIQDFGSEGGLTFGFFIIGVHSKPVEIKGDKLLFQSSDKKIELTLKLDPQRNPKTIDAEVGKGVIVFHGIYELTEDSLRLCFSQKDRPSEFKNSPTTPCVEFKRK